MFNNNGNRVEGLALFTCIVGIVGSVIGAIVLWTHELVGAGIAVLIGGGLSAWIGSWVVYYIGETNVKVTEMQETIESLQKQIRHQNIVSEKEPDATKNRSVHMSDPADEHSAHEKPGRVVGQASTERPLQEGFTRAIFMDEKKEKCENCGAIQKADRRVCWNCGMKFQRDE